LTFSEHIPENDDELMYRMLAHNSDKKRYEIYSVFF